MIYQVDKPIPLKVVAHEFDVTMKTVYQWVRGVGGRRLETFRMGGKQYTTPSAIERFKVVDDHRLPNTISPRRQAELRPETIRGMQDHGIR